MERDVVRIWGRGTGAGAADLTAVKGMGLAKTAPVDQTATGKYTINLADKWPGLLMFKACVIDPGATDDWEVVLVSETVASNGKVNIAVFKGGALADLSTDEKLLFEVVISNSNKLPKGY
jgi:hypothetical protein